MSTELNGLDDMRAHLIETLVSLGRTPEGATRQVADFEAAIRVDQFVPAIKDSPHERRAKKQIQKRNRRGA